MGQPSFITAPTIAAPYGSGKGDYPVKFDRGVDTYIRRNNSRFYAGYYDKPIGLRTVKDVERENDGGILDELGETFQ